MDELILNALLTRLTSPALTGSPPIASPLVAYTPTSGTAYLHAHPILRAVPEQYGSAFASDIIRTGIFQVDAVMPDGAGEAPGIRLATLVAVRFASGTTLAVGSYLLRVLAPATVAAAIKDAPWVRFPVSIPYRVVSA